MPQTLSDLPSELVEGIVCHLGFLDLCSLRLTNRATDAASSQSYFKSFFVTKTLRLDRDAVIEFREITQRCRFAACLRGLTLVGLPIQPDDMSSGSDVEDVLCNAFRNLQRQTECQGLRSISVSIDDTCGTDLNVRFAAGASAVRTTLRALNESGLPVESLNLLADTSQSSVPCDVFGDLFEPAQPFALWSRLRKLSMSLTDYQRMGILSQEGDVSTETQFHSNSTGETSAADERRVQAPTNFFALFSGIEEFHLHWYKLRGDTQSDADLAELRWFDAVSQAVPFNNLRILTLRGVHATQSALRNILTTPMLQSVHLEYVHVREGSFRPVLDCLIAPGRRLDHICLDDIFEDELEMLYFCVEGAPKFRSMRKGPGPSTVRRSGKEVAMPLEYGYARGRILGSSNLVRYWERRRSEFGPPDLDV
jgi:hypothetical protein